MPFLLQHSLDRIFKEKKIIFRTRLLKPCALGQKPSERTNEKVLKVCWCFVWIVTLTKFDQTKQQPVRLAAACQREHGSSLQTVSIERILRERADVPLLRVLQRRKRKKSNTKEESVRQSTSHQEAAADGSARLRIANQPGKANIINCVVKDRDLGRWAHQIATKTRERKRGKKGGEAKKAGAQKAKSASCGKRTAGKCGCALLCDEPSRVLGDDLQALRPVGPGFEGWTDSHRCCRVSRVHSSAAPLVKRRIRCGAWCEGIEIVERAHAVDDGTKPQMP